MYVLCPEGKCTIYEFRLLVGRIAATIFPGEYRLYCIDVVTQINDRFVQVRFV